MPFVGREGLKNILFSNVAEIKFTRRHPREDTKTRRMLCCGAYPNFHTNKFLNTLSSQYALNFRLPKGSIPYPPRPYYNPDAKNLVISWDLFMQDYRCINIRNCNVIRVFPVNTDEEIKEFWKYFNKHLFGMSPQQKTDFFKK